MTVLALVAGKIWKQPEGRTSKNGKAFATAIMREGAGDPATWWSVVASAGKAGELLQLKDGDGVSGPFSIQAYVTRDGQNHCRPEIIADRITAPRLSGRKSAA
jgi:hypothetical protein